MRLIVTGSSGGIGAEIVRLAIEREWSVVGLDLSGESDPSATFVTLPCDISDPQQCAVAVETAARLLGGLDGVVLSAGINLRGRFVDAAEDDVRRLWDVNVGGAVNVLRAAHAPLARSEAASVVCLSSISGQLGFMHGSYYAMSKHALEAMVRSLAVEWATDGIRLNAVAPAIVPTQMNADVRERPGYVEKKVERIPLGRMISAQEVAESVVYLLSGASSGVTGQVLNVDGGAGVMG